MTEFHLIPPAIFNTGHSTALPDVPPNRRCVFYAWDQKKIYFVDTNMEWVELEFTVPDHTHDASDIVSGVLDAERIPDELPGKNVSFLEGFAAADFAPVIHTHDAADIISGVIELPRLPIMIGATNIANGEAGLVPQPMSGMEDYYLSGDATWKSVPSGGRSKLLWVNA